MIPHPASTRIWLCAGVTDMRRGATRCACSDGGPLPRARRAPGGSTCSHWPMHTARNREGTGYAMGDLTLVIGNKNYSSWSLRPWLAMRHSDIPFEERLILLFDENWEESIARVSPSRRVPVLLHCERRVWETLAILEYINELFPNAGLWPSDRDARAHARAIANEMHAGFTALRTKCP